MHFGNASRSEKEEEGGVGLSGQRERKIRRWILPVEDAWLSCCPSTCELSP